MIHPMKQIHLPAEKNIWTIESLLSQNHQHESSDVSVKVNRIFL